MPAEWEMPIAGVTVGHWTDSAAQTGCTAVIFPPGSVGSAEIRGGAPASRELDVMDPQRTVAQIDAAVITGGSAFGLASADGVMRWLEEQGRGVPTPGGVVPIVPTLGLFDLAVGDSGVRPGSDEGYAAASAASTTIRTGMVGAGTGARASSWRGPDGRVSGGLHWAEERRGELMVGVLVAVNALGDVETGAGEQPDFATLEGVLEQMKQTSEDHPRDHTTIGVVITNAVLDKTGCLVLAQGAHDGLARALTPPHTRMDGDGFIVGATGAVEAPVDLVRLMALSAAAAAIRSSRRTT